MAKLLATLFLLASATMAQTFVVDVNNGPGTNFTSIAAAVQVVPDGATLIVRPGTYSRFTIDGKGLTLLGGGVIVQQTNIFDRAIEVKNTAASQPVVLRGLALDGNYQSCQVRDCNGSVLVEDLVTSAGLPTGDAWIAFQRCAQVMLRGVVTNGTGAALTLDQCDTVLENCRVLGRDHWTAMGAVRESTKGVEAIGGSLTVIDCTIRGGSGGWPGFSFNWAAIEATGADLRVLGNTTLTGGDGPLYPAKPAIDGSGTQLRLDPAVVLNSTAATNIGPGITTTITALPGVVGTSTSPGGSLLGIARGPVGNLVVLVLGLPGPPFAVPGIADPFWLDPAVNAFVAIGTPQQGAPLTTSVAVPPGPAFRGLVLGWQSFALLQGTLAASNASWTLVH